MKIIIIITLLGSAVALPHGGGFKSWGSGRSFLNSFSHDSRRPNSNNNNHAGASAGAVAGANAGANANANSNAATNANAGASAGATIIVNMMEPNGYGGYNQVPYYTNNVNSGQNQAVSAGQQLSQGQLAEQVASQAGFQNAQVPAGFPQGLPSAFGAAPPPVGVPQAGALPVINAVQQQNIQVAPAAPFGGVNGVQQQNIQVAPVGPYPN